MKTSHIMSGSCCLPLMKPMTSRPVACWSGLPFASRAQSERRTSGSAAVSAPTTSLRGDPLLAAVTDAMVSLHERYYHRAPVTAKTLLLSEEVLICVLGGIYTDVEKTLIEVQRTTMEVELFMLQPRDQDGYA